METSNQSKKSTPRYDVMIPPPGDEKEPWTSTGVEFRRENGKATLFLKADVVKNAPVDEKGQIKLVVLPARSKKKTDEEAESKSEAA